MSAAGTLAPPPNPASPPSSTRPPPPPESPRAGEISALTLGHVVLDGEEPYVRVLGKGSVTRDCPLAPELVEVLTDYLVSRWSRTR